MYEYTYTENPSLVDDWEKRLSSPDVQITKYKKSVSVRHFHLIAEEIVHPILSDVRIKALGYNGSTPGPVIVMRQGEWIALTVENRLNEDTALHVHGLTKPNPQDGVPEIEPSNVKIKPGTSHTYEFYCWQSGTFFYHSSMGFQVSQGLIGAFIVLPIEERLSYNIVPNRDFVLLLQQWEIPQQSQLGKVASGVFELNKFDRNPNFFTINGKAFPDTSPLLVRYGEHIKIRFINKSSQAHSMHTHGHDFTVTHIDGFPRYSMLDDTINVASGRRVEVDFITNNPGVWPLNGTKTFHQSNNGVSPGGMITRIVYTE
jgi:FtsP/CotA-like multicopper oxidase with cupredoxin domain